MRHDTQTRPAASGPAGGDPARVAALHRLARATATPRPAPLPAAPSLTEPLLTAPSVTEPSLLVAPPAPDPAAAPTALSGVPWADRDPDGWRPPRIPPAEPDAGAWADPPWWGRIRWAPSRVAGIALVVLVVALGAFSVHRLLATVPEGPAVPELPLATPDETVPPDGSSQSSPTPTAQAGAEAAAADEEVVVSVVGLVGRSGLVTVAPGARVADALVRAGGVLEGGDRDGLNLARKVVDGEQILVGLAPGPDGPRGPRSGIIGADSGSVSPGESKPAPAGEPNGATSASGGDNLVNINTADTAGLESLPGVGPVTAAAILSWREANGTFSSVDQLAEVNGIGPATLGRLRPLVTV